MANIKVMDEILANKIAAGEVVERCSSVVKELVENSIDAGATEITVELEDAGTKMIRVIDNGKGMDKEDALLAFQRHATSKLKEEEDLYRINTLGFRGEALPSIASVSNIVLKTSTGEVGTIVHISGGKIINQTNGDARKGTIMSVNDLFYNTPARLKHLKSLYSELANVSDYMNKIALSHPNIKFTLINNEQVLLKTDGRGELLKTIKDIYGLEVVKKMFRVEASNDDYKVEGYISYPEVNRSTRNHIITIVNGRVVRNMDINRIINDSYHSYKPDNRYPIVVLEIEVDPSLIDVNIHPTKMDIKFSKMDMLMELISNMIKKVLDKKNLIPEVEVSRPKLEEEKVIKSVKEDKQKYQEFTLNLTRTEENEEPYVVINEDLIVKKEEPKEEISENKEEKQNERMPELYPVGLVHGTYIICQNEKGMYLIDQHAAKERINYEIFKKELGNPKKNKISMLFPLTLEFTNSEFIILKEHFDLLRDINIDIEEFGLNSVIIKAHPTWLPKGYEEQAIRKIIEVVLVTEKEFNIEKFNEKIAIMLSCKLAIKANMNLTLLEMETLINDLRKCDNPFNCPHGRPTTIFYTNYDLEKLFKRSGFELID
ncbi:MAG: DNA mismatch repair endonuclease MutL [Bacilli bacterium]|nr:DNA mismatch repair endonuclease MutL [Bacilli bacterium]